ncbi:RNA polymerase sigma factor [Luteimonas salinilitoris]|uniref:RNA polymerase sigma factor n=1 Tax=Luteimonas salinilitoris TaxID=3237697 RepID=A0ABV4HNN9_9GAMM
MMPAIDRETYRALRDQARKLTRSAADAEDLLQEVLLAALRAGRADPPWLAGVLRRQAALAIRGSVRARRRERHAEAGASPGHDEPATESVADPCTAPQVLRQLSPAARQVAVLALHGLSPEEIRWVLELSAAAFRQRLTSIRKSLDLASSDLRAQARALAYVRDPPRSVDLQFGLVRRALKAAIGERAALGTHDEDGHLLLVRRHAHTSGTGGNE